MFLWTQDVLDNNEQRLSRIEAATPVPYQEDAKDLSDSYLLPALPTRLGTNKGD